MFDLVIIGSSAAGVSAGIYAARRNLNFKIVTLDTGGEVATSGEIANYPGFGQTDGIALSEKFVEHLKMYNIEPEIDVKVSKIDPVKSDKSDHGVEPRGGNAALRGAGSYFKVTADKLGKEVTYEAKTAIVTTGVHPRLLGIAGEEKYRGKGVTYCTTCDGPLFKNKVVATIGGGNSALESVLMLDSIASKVYLINKNPQFKGDAVLIDKVNKAQKVEIIYEAKTLEIFGAEFVKGLKYKDKSDQEHTLSVEGVFVHIGMLPNSEFLPEGIDKNQFGEIKVNQKCETNIPGLFAAGDVTDIPYKQIGIAVGQGICAALAAVDYLNKLGS